MLLCIVRNFHKFQIIHTSKGFIDKMMGLRYIVIDLRMIVT